MEDLDDEDEEQLKNSNISKEDLIREHNENEVRKGIVRARLIYREANKALRDCEDKEQRVRLLESWKEFEVSMNNGFFEFFIIRQFFIFSELIYRLYGQWDFFPTKRSSSKSDGENSPTNERPSSPRNKFVRMLALDNPCSSP